MSNATNSPGLERVEHRACFCGWQDVYEYRSDAFGTVTRFAAYLPPQVESGPVPVLYWLSGLTCNEQNFITKAGAQRYAAEHGIMLVAPDSSPRGDGVPNDDGYDLAQGAGFYVDATQKPWSSHYNTFEHVVSELPRVVEAALPASDVRSIAGHSMGGHGALVIALRRPGSYRSASAFSPIVAPSQVPWGRKAFTAYLGDNRAAWASYDTVELIKSGSAAPPLLIDQGGDDEFLENQLKPNLLRDACAAKGVPLSLNLRTGYDHSYYFIASFIGEHIAFHARHLAVEA